MKNLKNRIIVDTNLWISYLLTKNYLQLDSLIENQEIILIFSQDLVDELIEVTQRKKFRKYFELNDLESLLLKIRKRSVFVNVSKIVGECRDEKDNFLLSLAVEGQATHLITGDKDLLIIGKFEKTQILTLTEFLKEYSF